MGASCETVQKAPLAGSPCFRAPDKAPDKTRRRQSSKEERSSDGDLKKEDATRRSKIFEGAIGKVRTTLLGTVGDLKAFREYMKPLFSSAKDLFVVMADGEEDVSEERFLRVCEELGFTGNAKRIYQTLKDEDGRVTLECFKQKLKAKKLNILDVVKLAKANRSNVLDDVGPPAALPSTSQVSRGRRSREGAASPPPRRSAESGGASPSPRRRTRPPVAPGKLAGAEGVKADACGGDPAGSAASTRAPSASSTPARSPSPPPALPIAQRGRSPSPKPRRLS